MLLKIITLRFSPTLERFDDTELMDFIKDKEVLSARNHFFIKNDNAYLAVVIHYLENHNASRAAGKPIKKDESWREIIKEEDLPLFNTLRSWRSERAKREGIAAYIICNNAELAQVVAARPQSLSDLAKINGFGKAKVEKYGKAILSILSIQKPSQDKREKADENEPDGKPVIVEQSSPTEFIKEIKNEPPKE